MTRRPWWYGYRLSVFRDEVVARMSDGELNQTRVEIEHAVQACERQGVQGADAAWANGKKLAVVEREIKRRREQGSFARDRA